MKTIILTNEETKAGEEFTQKEIAIGRSKDCDFTTLPQHTSISRNHCTIVQNEKGVSVKDHSTNGTTVRGKTLSKDEHAALSDGDTIQLGENYILKVSIKDDDNKSRKPAPTDQTSPEKEEEIKLILPDDEFNLGDDDNLNKEPPKKPSSSDLKKDLAEIDEKINKKINN